MIPRQHLSVLFWFAVLMWALMLILQGTSLPSGFFKPASTVLGALVVVIGAFDKWLWRLSILQRWFVSRPDLTGTWKGQLISTWINPATGSPVEPIEGYLVVRQTFSSIQMNLVTNEASSELLASTILRKANGGYLVAGIYQNMPKLLIRSGSPIHHGGVLLHVRGSPPRMMEGEYWTDRDTKGELRFTGRSSRIFASFEAASGAEYKSAEGLSEV